MDQDQLLYKWLNGQLTEEEKKALEQLPDYDLNRKIIAGARIFKAPDFPVEERFREWQEKRHERGHIRTLWRSTFYYPMAAALILALGLIFIFIGRVNTVTIKTGAFEKKTVLLPDASSVVLNVNSELKYNRLIWKFKRQVDLDGNAFFKVAKGSRFDVETSKGEVSVLGTQFEVKARDSIFEVKCFEGVVRVNIPEKAWVLQKGKALRVWRNQVEELSVEQNRPNWLMDETYYRSVPLYVVLQALEKHYQIHIKTQSVDTTRRFTGVLIKNDLELALRSVTEVFGLKYRMDDNQKIVVISAR